jgi:uncharacterized SAM-binding protein YcdF (DUF218 family)
MRLRSLRPRPIHWLLLALLGLALALHPLWLGAVGDFLVARDELQPADAIVVLAGNSPYRAQHAAELYRAGWAPKVLISNELVQSHGVEVSWLTLRQAGLVHLDLPDEAIIPLEQIALSTYHEATESRDLMLRNGWHRAILVTDPFHMRRALWAFHGVWQKAGLEIIASPAENSKFTVTIWWRDPNRATRVIQEYVKFPYYLLTGQF